MNNNFKLYNFNLGSQLSNELNQFNQKAKLFTQSLTDIINEQTRKIQDENKRISEFIKNVWTDTYNDEYKNNLIIWGSYGWTMHPDDIIAHFYTAPKNKEDADEQMKEFLEPDYVESLMNVIKEHTTNSDDFEESLFSFNNKKYKSCACIVFSLIDWQRYTLIYDVFKKHEKLALSTDNNMNDKIIKTDKEKILELWPCINKCIEKMYDGDNFENDKDSDVINRNRLVHGAMRTSPTRTDCIKIYLLYLNYLWTVEIIKSCNMFS